jgi:biotin carboxylase
MGRVRSYPELQRMCAEHGLGDDLVIQTPYGDSGRTTFFIKNQSDWKSHEAELVDHELKVMKRINHIPYTLEAVATRCGTLVGPVLADITGFEELTPYRGGWAGNDISRKLSATAQAGTMQDMARALGDRLYREGYKGTFCADFLLDTDTQQVYLGELNPRISGASALTNLVTSKYGGAPLMMFHLLEFMGLDYEIDVERIQQRWADFDIWSQLVFKETGEKKGQITKAPVSGVWRMRPDGTIRFIRRSIDWYNVGDEDEAFYMRIYGIGEVLYHGADIGILVTRGRMQTDDRKLTERAKVWVKALQSEFETATPAED